MEVWEEEGGEGGGGSVRVVRIVLRGDVGVSL